MLFTGTPEGVSPIEPGDRIVATIERIGTMHGGRRGADERQSRSRQMSGALTAAQRLECRRPTMDGASTTFFTKPALTPERKEFYERLERAQHGAAVGSARRDHPAGAAPRGGAGAVALRRAAAAADGSRPAAHREGSRAPRAGAREPRTARPIARTGSLYAGLQLILPGEIARCHRHAASALRFVIEGAAPTPPSKASGRRCTPATSS